MNISLDGTTLPLSGVNGHICRLIQTLRVVPVICCYVVVLFVQSGERVSGVNGVNGVKEQPQINATSNRDSSGQSQVKRSVPGEVILMMQRPSQKLETSFISVHIPSMGICCMSGCGVS